MAGKHQTAGICLPEGHTGSTFFHQVLQEAVAAFPAVFRGVELPSARQFRRTYGETVVQFEAARAASPQRSEVARFVVDRTRQLLRYQGHGFDGSLRDYLAGEEQAPVLQRQPLAGRAGLDPLIPFHGEDYRGAAVAELAGALLQERKITRAAATALSRIAAGGTIDLRGQKFVIFGAAAEIAPTPLLLAAGASVLWVDLQSPDDLLHRQPGLAGELVLADGARDILAEPRRILAAIRAFAADGDPVHVGMFAYAPGASQEWRLAAAMNALVSSLDPGIVASVSMFVSPTSAAVIQPEDVSGSGTVFAERPFWQSALRTVGQLREEAGVQVGDTRVARAIVPIQGVSYQAAQYISKMLAAEVFATRGIGPDGGERPVRVSANVAGITKTRSLNHPVFEAAFLGADRFGVEVFEAGTTRALSGLLVLHDLLHGPATPGDVRDLFARQVHGGIYSRPYSLYPMIRVAALMGMARRPGLLLKALQGGG